MCHFRFLLVSILIDFYGVGVRAALSLIAYTLLMLRLVYIMNMVVVVIMLVLLLVQIKGVIMNTMMVAMADEDDSHHD